MKLVAKIVIEVKKLKKKYNKADGYALKGIDLSVKEGEFFAFLGPNGAGKTTTVQILTTLLSKTSGKAIIDGFDIEKEDKKVRERVGIIFQNPSLDENLTAEENVRFHTNLYNLYPYRFTFGMMPKEYQEKVLSLAKILDIQKEIHNPIKTFSGGMKRKLEIIRSLMHNPKILFLDEPTTGLDPVSRKNLWKYLQKVRNEEDLTIFLTTHYLEEAEDADSVAIIDNGEIVAKGTPKEIRKGKDSLEEAYIDIVGGISEII